MSKSDPEPANALYIILRAFSKAFALGAIRTRSSANVGFPALRVPIVQPVPESSSSFRRPPIYKRKYQVDVIQPWRTPCFIGKIADLMPLT